MDAPDILQQLVDDGIIDDVRARLMSGKEASVFIVERRGELVAAKVYKEREHRTFKATASYTEGRNQTRNTRDKRAMQRRTSYGKELVESSWRDMEYQALFDAFSAGVRVPEPLLLYENVLLMELLVDEGGAPAPRLAEFQLTPEVATLLHREIFGQVRMLLRAGRIHGDLSAFNILIARDGPTLIDMPQVVDASMNTSAAEILQRDLQNVTEHLARFDSRLLRFRHCGAALWEHYRRGNIDLATEPEEGVVRRQDGRGRRGRRERDAERGHAGRGNAPREQRPRHEGGPPPGVHSQHEQRPPHAGQRPRQEPRPQHGERPRQDQRPQHGERPRQDQRPQHGERPRQDQRPQHGERPRQDQRPQHDERPRQDQRPQHGERPRQDQRPAREPPHQRRGPPPPQQPRRPEPRRPEVERVPSRPVRGPRDDEPGSS